MSDANPSLKKTAITHKESGVFNGLPKVLNQAIIANGFVFVSGAIAVDVDGKIVGGEDDVAIRTHQCIKNLAAVLEAAGTNINNVVKVNVFLTDMKNFTAMNNVYETYWGDVKPVRTCVAVHQLPLGTDVEIECTAVL